MNTLTWTNLLAWSAPILSAAAISYIFGKLFVRFGETHSNRVKLSQVFVLIAMTTTAIIMVIKSSIALSLGLVGALSIVRFRVAIKEPEELAYLFLMIAMGIGLGANEFGLTLVFAIIVGLVLILKNFRKKNSSPLKQSFNIDISSKKLKETGPEILQPAFDKWCSQVSLRRFDESSEKVDVLYFVKFRDKESFSKWRLDVLKIDKDSKITFLDLEW